MEKLLKKNILFNLIKAVTSILFPMITFKYASNVLSAENLGIVSFCSSIIGYFTLLAGLGITSYATREGSGKRNQKNEILDFSNQVYSINLVSCCISFVILVVAINTFNSLRPYRYILLVQSLVMIFTTLGTEWINIIYEDFIFITIRTVFMQIVSLVLLFLFVKSKDDYLVYAGIIVLAQVGMYVLNIFHVRKTIKIKPTIHIEWKNHLKPILIIFASTIAVTIYATIDTTMIGLFCAKEDVAYYSAATKIYSALKSIFATVLAVLIPRLSYLFAQSIDSYEKLLDKVTRGIFILLIPCTILSNVLCKDLILLISGSDYLSAYSSLHVLSFAVVFSAFSTCIVNNVFLIRKKENITLIATIVGAIVDFALNLLLIRKIGYFGASITTLIAEMVVFVICYVALKMLNMSIVFPNDVVKCVTKDLLAGTVMFFICIGLYRVIENYLLRIFAVGIIGVVTFLAMLLLMKHDMLYAELKKITSNKR